MLHNVSSAQAIAASLAAHSSACSGRIADGGRALVERRTNNSTTASASATVSLPALGEAASSPVLEVKWSLPNPSQTKGCDSVSLWYGSLRAAEVGVPVDDPVGVPADARAASFSLASRSTVEANETMLCFALTPASARAAVRVAPTRSSSESTRRCSAYSTVTSAAAADACAAAAS